MTTRPTQRASSIPAHIAPFYPWAVVGLFWFVFFLNQADRQVIFSVFPLVKTDMNLTDTQLGVIGSAFFWVYALLVPVAGGLGDVFSRKWIVIGSLAVWSAATFGSTFAMGLAALVVLRAFTAAGEAFYYPSAASIISDYHGEESRSTALSVHQTANYFGVMVSGGLAGYIGQHYGWRSAFMVFGLAGIVVALGAAKFLVEPKRGLSDRSAPRVNGNAWSRCASSLKTPSFWLHMTAFLAMLVALTAYLTWTPTLLYRKFGMDLTSAGLNATLWHHLGAMAGTLLGGRLADRLALRRVVSRPAIQAVGLFLGAPFIFMAGQASTPVLVFAALALFGFFRGVYDSNLFASPFEVVRPDARATATGLMLAVGFCGGGAGPLLAGRLSQSYGLGAGLSATSIFYVVGGALLLIDCLFFFRRGAHRMREESATA
ncbi:MFS transporter [uncultured Paludibaculum sp.]|uniref:spinster family MFS transporter n=1 Tax=uncultured Paludibaculum sp. TaxID=1765020 RepID=UPI002AAAC7EF|nr:MFS transporter [uncultured Paludibaculum sp.]